MWRTLILQYVLLANCGRAIMLPQRSQETEADEARSNSSDLKWTASSVGRVLAQCLGGQEPWHCLEVEAERMLDTAAHDNSTWQVTDYLSIEPQMGPHEMSAQRGARKDESNSLAKKLLQLVQRRALRMRMPRASISNAIDDFGSQLGLDQGRKKKDKDKHMAMMGGMIMIATLAQLFLGKVLLIAGSAFVMAKIALVISLLGSLKKGSHGQSGSKDHVIVTNAPSGHSHESGWHRSMPTSSYSHIQLEPQEEHGDWVTEEAAPEEHNYYEAGEEAAPFQRRQAITHTAATKPSFL